MMAKINKTNDKMLMRMCGKGNPYALLVEKQTGLHSLEIRMDNFQKDASYTEDKYSDYIKN